MDRRVIQSEYSPRRYDRQKGTTLLSLMAGLLVSTISILASLSMYQNLRVAAADTKNGVVHDGQIAATFLVAEKYLMNAGYGISNAGVDDIKVVSQAATSTDPATISLLWRYHDGTSVICAGFLESSILIDARQYRVLKAIESVGDCTLSDDLATLSWNVENAILGQWPVTTDVASYLSSNDTLFNFQVDPVTCTPYGYGIPSDHLVVTISVPGTVELSGAFTVGGNESHFCLPNLYPV